MKRVYDAGQVVNSWRGSSIQIPKRVEPDNPESDVVNADATIADIFDLIVKRAQYKGEEDGKESRRILEALEEAKKTGEITLDIGTHRWLVNQSKAVIWPLFRWNGEFVEDAVKNGYKEVP